MTSLTAMAQPKDDKLEKLVKWFDDFANETQKARQLAERDRDYYDGKQWTDSEVHELNKRNQPIITVNKIAPKVNYIRGYEVQTRIDPKAFPRTPAHEDEAIAVTDALRFVADREDFDSVRSRVLEEMLIEGYSGVVVEPEPCSDGEIEIRLRHVPFDRIFYDPRSRRPDFSDAKYLGVVTWWHLDDAKADPVYGKHPRVLEEAEAFNVHDEDTFEDRPHTNWIQTDPSRIQVCEIYWKEDGEWWAAHLCRTGFLVESKKLPLVGRKGHTYCPLLVTSAFVDRDNARRGAVRDMISLQDEINKRRSKALHLLTMRQVYAEESAVLEPGEAKAELTKPDGWVRLNHGALAEKRFEVAQTTDLAQGQLQLLQDASVSIDAVGPQSPVIGGDRRVMSGTAILARQQAGSMELEPLFDSLRSWQKRVFYAVWYQIRQFWPEERWVRVRDDAELTGWRFVALNRRMTRAERCEELKSKGVSPDRALQMVGLHPVELGWVQREASQAAQEQMAMAMQQMQASGQQAPPEAVQQFQQQLMQQSILQHPRMQEVLITNDVGELDVDIVLDATPDTAVVQQEEFRELAEFGQANPGAIPPKVLIQSSQFRNKRELLSMLEQKPDPMAEQMKQLQVALMQAEVKKTEAQAADEQASAQERMAQISTLGARAEEHSAKAMKAAAEAGEKTLPDAPAGQGPMGQGEFVQ